MFAVAYHAVMCANDATLDSFMEFCFVVCIVVVAVCVCVRVCVCVWCAQTVHTDGL